jgi:SOS response associated peptidase (SRAP)
MCGRYDYTPGEFREIRIRWNLEKDLPLFKPCYNIAPGRDVPVIVREGEDNQMKLMRWGLVPSMVWFIWGLAAGIVGHGLAYLTNLLFYRGSKIALRWRWSALGAAFLSVVLFIAGCYTVQ